MVDGALLQHSLWRFVIKLLYVTFDQERQSYEVVFGSCI